MKQSVVKIVAVIMLAGVFSCAHAQSPTYIQSLDKQNHWVDSVFSKLNRKHKVSQLFFIRAHTNKGQAYADSVAKVIKCQQPGGLVFFQGGPMRQAMLTNQYQKLAQIPLLVAMDGEWGLGMRLDSVISYPYQMALGAIRDNTLITEMGRQVAYDFKRLGMQMNFAPVMDVNNNPNNPVINYRSFGDDKYNVAQKAIAYMQGMQQGGLLTTAKHFPGHGDTNVDSHFDLPQLNFTRTRLDTLEEYPFKQAIAAGISGIMVAHMNIPALDTTQHLPSTLSRPIVTNLLQDTLGFKGLVVSDALEMKGVTKYFPAGEADLRAFIAGNDILELSENSALAIKKIKKAVRKGVVLEAELDAKVKKVLAAKYWAGLNHYQPADTTHLIADLNRTQSKTLVQQLSNAAITVLRGDTLLQYLDPTKATALVSIGVETPTVYQQELARYFTAGRMFQVSKGASANQMSALLTNLKSYEQIIIGIHDTRLRPQSQLDYTAGLKQFIARLAAYPNTVVSLFANPYTLDTLPGIEQSGALLVGYQKDEGMQRAAVGVITKQFKATGKLPVHIGLTRSL
ncbi:glycoside hydrolase family 3 [Mucilaginibacter robiniae]|uniref:beta-N-acetylhexosaminidase n=1 Tax=Mucilaginibacter robiniae TaxID=2728022 RepID=A0A7L5DXL4_9SPHI|nr:glycoside hydrolase family 3 N-terminal domain-containing protein [Mucilaginibacter robiniae]QJD95852.1 glycoside hydrolase family 3 [Mucilaginibacter robiniae]